MYSKSFHSYYTFPLFVKDNNFRNLITKKIAKNKNNLFNDEKPIRFLEEVIRKKLL